MKETTSHFLICAIALGLLFASSIPSAFAQSQALNGQIEGTISDQTGAAVPNAEITVTNLETGATRALSTDESGVYRFPLLPLGTYRITAKAANFKKLAREGITLTTGQTATVDFNLQTGDINEVVTVSADSSVADAGKTDLGRVMNTREAQNLPLINRNPYNFGFLQANVTGRPRGGFAFPNFNVNGYLRRVNYQLDGNTNTTYEVRRRFMFISDTYVSEIQLVTNGFAAEFGDTPGMIMNIVTPSGTNKFSGAVSYRFRRPPFYSRPFFYPSPEDVPDNRADNFTATVGAPIIRDRWHFYFGYEWLKRDDKAVAVRLLTITPADRARLIAAGLAPAIFPPAIPSVEKGSFYIFRTDLQINDKNRLTARFNHSDSNTANFIQGRLNTLERSVDAVSVDYALAVQLASYTPKVFNEFRFQSGRRSPGFLRNEFSGTGPSIVITDTANFGSPTNADTIFPPLRVTQFQDNLTRTTGTHVVKFGGGFSIHNYTERAAVFSQYTFPSIDAYINARNGTNPRSYARYTETFGNPETEYKATYWNFFVQDDLKMTRRLKFNYGLRYDFYQIPEADRSSPFPLLRKFNTDKNDFAPRVGVVYALREGTRPTILRAGAGIYYDAPLLSIYRNIIRFNGNSRFFSFTFTPTTTGAPAFPNTLGTLPSGLILRPDIFTIAPDFATMYALHFNIQLEQAITENLSFAAGFVHSAGRQIPVYRNINSINPVRFLSDGRPVFGADRLDARFGTITIVESGGVSGYNALTLQLNQRLSRGLQFSINYTLSRAINDTPDGAIENLFLSDPTNRGLDKGFSSADQRHTFVMSLVFQPQFNFPNKALRYLFNNNQFGIIATANSGERFNIISNSDLNGDDFSNSDRPIGVKRNAGKTPPQFNTDLRYSRFFKFTDRYRLEVFGEFQNLFNVNSIVGFNNVTVTTNPTTGELIGELPDFRARNQSTAQDSRQVQIGFKFIF